MMPTLMENVHDAPAPAASQATGFLAWLSIGCGVVSVLLWLFTGMPFPLIAAVGLIAGWLALRRYEDQPNRRLAKAGAWIGTACLGLVILGLLTGVLFISSFG